MKSRSICDRRCTVEPRASAASLDGITVEGRQIAKADTHRLAIRNRYDGSQELVLTGEPDLPPMIAQSEGQFSSEFRVSL